MKIFGITIGKPEQKTLSRADILGELASLQGASKSGARVNWKTAGEVSTALACAKVIAEGLAQVPFKLFRETPNGGREAAKSHKLYTLLGTRPNEWQTSYEFREMLGLHMVFAGNAYVFINKTGERILELLPFAPQQVTVKRNDWAKSFVITTQDGRQIPIPAANMWHLPGPSWDGVVGLDAVKLAREAIGLALATEEHGARMFSNGARVGGILSSESALKEEQVKALRDSWEKTQGGVANAFKTAILWGGLKWSPMAMPNDQAQLIEQRRFQVEEICRHFRVMPIMVGYSDKSATYASAEQMFLAHVVHTLGPWYARVEQSADVFLLTEQERESGYYFKFLAAGLMRGAHQDRAAYYSKALGSGGAPAWMTQDEVRALEEMNPMGGAAAALPIATNVPQPGAQSGADEAADATKAMLTDAITRLSHRPDPTITVKAGDVHITQPAISITNEPQPAAAPDVKIDVHVPESAPPVMHMSMPAPEVKIDVQPPTVEVHVDAIMPDKSEVSITSMPARETRSTIERDGNGNIIQTTQTERDERDKE